MAANRIVTQIRRGSSGSQAELEAAQPQPVIPTDFGQLAGADIEVNKLFLMRMQTILLVRIAEALGVSNPVPTVEEVMDTDVVPSITNALV